MSQVFLYYGKQFKNSLLKKVHLNHILLLIDSVFYYKTTSKEQKIDQMESQMLVSTCFHQHQHLNHHEMQSMLFTNENLAPMQFIMIC